MQALGNDFMLLDCREQAFDVRPAKIMEWANRRTGVGFDQLIVIESHAGQLAYRFFNADGGEAEQCGNGQRAIALYLHQNGVAVDDLLLTGRGGDVILNYQDQDRITVTFKLKITMQPQTIAGIDGFFVDMGNPHWVYHEPELRGKDLLPVSHLVNQAIDTGANVEAINKIDDQHIQLRVIERGVGETQACGSGACAAAIASAHLLQTTAPLTVSMLGGDVLIGFDADHQQLSLTGPARRVYQGQI